MIIELNEGIYIDGFGFFPKRVPKPKVPKKKKPDSYFETLTLSQLKDLCKASKLAVSGTKADLVTRLMNNKKTRELGHDTAAWELKRECQERLLVVGGNKYDLMLRILHHDYETETVKRAATETIVDDDGQDKEVLKKRAKIILKPARLYEKVKNKMHAVKQKRYQTKYGSKNHSPAVCMLLEQLINEHCIDSKMVETDPLYAYDQVKAIFQAFYDHWPVMERPGYGSHELRIALGAVIKVFEAIKPHLSPVKVEEMVSLLESVEACVRPYCLATHSYYDWDLHKHINGNFFLDRVYPALMPDYNRENREPKEGVPINSDLFPFLGSGMRLTSTTVIRNGTETQKTTSTFTIED
jgi:hypothetical protein